MANTDLVSVVVPCYNEHINIQPLYDRLSSSMEKAGYNNFELIFVENGCTDNSPQLIMDLRKKDPRVKMVQLSRNYGYQGAISSGMFYAGGTSMVSLDGDLQDPPELVPSLLNKLKEGNDVVYGVRIKRQEGFWIKMCYKMFYIIWQKLSHIHVPRDAGDFCAMTRRVVDHMNALPERNRFLRGLRVWVGFKHAALPYERDARQGGDSKFSLGEYFALATDAIISFSTIPLRLLLMAGCILSLFFVLGIIALIVLRIMAFTGTLPTEEFPKGFTINSLLLMAFGAVNLMGLGTIGEYVGRIYEETKQRPHFIVAELFGIEKK